MTAVAPADRAPYLTGDRRKAELLELWERTVEFGRRELETPDLRQRDRDGIFWREGWRRCAGFGVAGLPVPEDLGGLGLSVTATMTVLDALGYTCSDAGLLFSLGAHLWSSVVPIWLHGSGEQKARYLGRLARGEVVGVHAMTEPGTGSDAFALQTRARPERDGFRISGSKTFITNAPIADVFIIFARLEGTHDSDGLTALIVERGTPGLTVGKPLEKMGLRTSPMAELALDDCWVGADALVGKVGSGAAVFNSSMLFERACIMASVVGAMQRQLETCISYARRRRQFGKPIGKFESVSEKVADMKVRLETSRALLYRTGAAMDSGEGGILEASVCKLYISEAAVAVHRDAVQLHGGYGYMQEFDVERDLRDVLGSTIYSGTSEMQRYIIGRMLGL